MSSKRLSIFIDDHACCALTGPAGALSAPNIALSSKIMMPKADGADKSGILVCDLKQDPNVVQMRLRADLGSEYEGIGLAQALEPNTVKHLLEHYLTALIASCLRLVDASGRFEEVVIALPLRSREYRRANPAGQNVVRLDDRGRVQSALNSIAPLFGARRFTLADAHELAAQAAEASFSEDLAAGSHAAVIGLWRERFSILHLTSAGNGHGASMLPIEATPITGVPVAALGTPIAKSLSPSSDTWLDDVHQSFRLVPPQMSLDFPGLYGGLDTQLSAVLNIRYPTTPSFGTEALNTANLVQVGSYALMGSLAINPAIRAGIAGSAKSPTLSRILGNALGPATCLSLHPVMSVLDRAMQINMGAAAPVETSASPRVASLGGHFTENRAAGIHPTKISEAQSTFSVGVTTGENPVIEIITLPSDKGLEVMVEYGHLEDGSITLKARLDRRVLPLKKADLSNSTDATDASRAQATVQAEAKLELMEDGGYRLTLNSEHREACQLRGDLRRLVTQGLRLHGSYGKENEKAS